MKVVIGFSAELEWILQVKGDCRKAGVNFSEYMRFCVSRANLRDFIESQGRRLNAPVENSAHSE